MSKKVNAGIVAVVGVVLYWIGGEKLEGATSRSR
jgi:hypothetical protein